MPTTAQDRAEFRGFCRQATDRQLPNIIVKEREAAKHDKDREIYAEIAEEEAQQRGVFCSRFEYSKREKEESHDDTLL